MSNPWPPGVSGNPAGRPPGAHGMLKRKIKEKMRGGWEAVVNSIMDKALEGDMAAAKIILDRIAPSPKGRCIKLGLPSVSNAADIMAALTKLVDCMSRGIISSEEAHSAAGVLELHRKAVETMDLERRMTALEKKRGKQ